MNELGSDSKIVFIDIRAEMNEIKVIDLKKKKKPKNLEKVHLLFLHVVTQPFQLQQTVPKSRSLLGFGGG